jgi:hypothetical protein
MQLAWVPSGLVPALTRFTSMIGTVQLTRIFERSPMRPVSHEASRPCSRALTKETLSLRPGFRSASGRSIRSETADPHTVPSFGVLSANPTSLSIVVFRGTVTDAKPTPPSLCQVRVKFRHGARSMSAATFRPPGRPLALRRSIVRAQPGERYRSGAKRRHVVR